MDVNNRIWETLVGDADTNQDHTISFEEFKAYLMGAINGDKADVQF